MINRPQPVIASYARSPFGLPKKGSLGNTHPVYLGGPALRTAVEKAGLYTTDFQKAIVGCATQTGSQGINVSRRVMKEAFGANAVPIYSKTVNVSCASSMDAAIEAATDILSGRHKFVLVGGIESNSFKQAPPGSDALLPPVNLKNIFKNLLISFKYRANPTRRNDELVKLTMPPDQRFFQMHDSGDYLARIKNYTRKELNEFAYVSFARAIHAANTGLFEDELVRVDLPGNKGYVKRDETIREDTSLFALSKLKSTIRDGFHTAGNSSQVGVGASALVIGSEEEALNHSIKPLAKIIGWAQTGTDPGIGQLLGLLEAVQAALADAGLTVDDIDLWEINEAFAAEVLVVKDHYKLDVDKINVNGGAIAISHPFGATGARIIGHLALEMQRRAHEIEQKGLNEKKPRYGVATLCVAQGLGAGVVLERYEN